MCQSSKLPVRRLTDGETCPKQPAQSGLHPIMPYGTNGAFLEKKIGAVPAARKTPIPYAVCLAASYCQKKRASSAHRQGGCRLCPAFFRFLPRSSAVTYLHSVRTSPPNKKSGDGPTNRACQQTSVSALCTPLVPQSDIVMRYHSA